MNHIYVEMMLSLGGENEFNKMKKKRNSGAQRMPNTSINT